MNMNDIHGVKSNTEKFEIARGDVKNKKNNLIS